MLKLVFTLALLAYSFVGFSQHTFYKMPNGKIIDSATYINAKANLSKNGKVEESIIKTETRSDSIIKSIKLTILTTKDANGNYYDPYKQQKDLIGKHFPIEEFKNSAGIFFKANELSGKPTLINLWFTSCPPCIEEIPLLNKLVETHGKKVNFISITYESKEQVNKFLKNKNIKFTHITDSKQQLKNMGVEAYPMNFIIDKFGIVTAVYGEISFDYEEINTLLKQSL